MRSVFERTICIRRSGEWCVEKHDAPYESGFEEMGTKSQKRIERLTKRLIQMVQVFAMTCPVVQDRRA